MIMSRNEEIILGNDNYDKVLIFNHGLGDDPSSWIFFAKEILKEINNIKIILTKAPINSVSVNKGIKMQSWFDIIKIPIGLNENFGDVSNSINIIDDFINNEISNGISSSKIFLGGFSQGAALSLLYGLTTKKNLLGGIICLSGWLMTNEIGKINNIPLFIGHGDKDNIVKYENADYANNFLKSKKCSLITFNKYSNMKHSISFNERKDVIDWIKKFF